MNTINDLDREATIEYIVENNPQIARERLETLSIASLVLIKVHIEIELAKQ